MKKKNNYKIVITDREYESIENESRILKTLDGDVDIRECNSREPDVIMKEAHDCDALIVQYAPVTAEMISRMKNCRIIARYATGVDGIDLKAAGNKGIYVANVRDYCTEEVATHVLCLLLELDRKTAVYSGLVKKGVWDYKYALPCGGLREKTVGIIGYGKIAAAFADKVRTVCSNIWIASDHADAEELLEKGFVLKTRDEIIRKADYISLHVPLNENNRYMIGSSEFKAMKKTACIINAARGGLICENALVTALEKGEIAGAALDVLEKEPPDTDNPLLGFDNVIITPHIAWYSEAAQMRLQSSTAYNVVKVLRGGQPNSCVNMEFLKSNM